MVVVCDVCSAVSLSGLEIHILNLSTCNFALIGASCYFTVTLIKLIRRPFPQSCVL